MAAAAGEDAALLSHGSGGSAVQACARMSVAAKAAVVATALIVTGGAVGLGLGLGLRRGADSSGSPASIRVTQLGVTLRANAGSQQRYSVSWAVPNDGLFPKTGPPGVKWSVDGWQTSHFAEANATLYADGDYTSPLLYAADFVLDGAPDGTRIEYSAGSDVDGFSAPRSFAALPPPSASGATFAVLGDLGTTENSVATVNHILELQGAEESASALIHVGDLSYADGTPSVWDTYGVLREPLSAVLATQSVPGNHEAEHYGSPTRSFAAYRSRFAPWTADEDHLYYSFESGLVHWVMIQGYCPASTSSTKQPCLSPGGEQVRWLIEDLASVDRQRTPWVVAVIHQPWINSNTKHTYATEGRPTQAAVEDILYSAQVDLVLAGHVHAYERAGRTYNNTCNATAPYYITIGDGGNYEGLASEWFDPQPAWSLFRQASFGHGRLFVANATHMRWRWHQNVLLAPEVSDDFWFAKNQAGPCGGGVTKAAQLSARGLRAPRRLLAPYHQHEQHAAAAHDAGVLGRQ